MATSHIDTKIATPSCVAGNLYGGSTIRHRLASLTQQLCNRNAVTYSPVKGVQRPKT